MLWQDGGPSPFETFDPKPDAPVEFKVLGTPIHDLSRSELRKLLLNYESELRARTKQIETLTEALAKPKIVTP